MKTIYQVPIPASLARRLAEAADGFRNVNEVFFVAGYEKPHTIEDFPDLKSAKAYFSKNGFTNKDHEIFGPYKTTDEVEGLNLEGVENIKKIDLTIHFKNGGHYNASLQGSIDSIFLNLSSFDKFVFPYYCHLYGVDFVKKMRDKLIAQYGKHKKGRKTGKAFLMPPVSQGGGSDTLLAPLSGHINKTYMLNLPS